MIDNLFFRAHFRQHLSSCILRADRHNEVFNVKTGSCLKEKADRVLVQAAMHGDLDSFGELCRRHYPAMVSIARAILHDWHLAEDASQEALAKVARNLKKLRNPDKFAGWLATTVRNAAKDMLRRQKPLGAIDDVDEMEVADTHSDNGDIEAVRQAIDLLPDEMRELIYLRYYDQMSYQEMSALLGISQQAINGRLRRGKKAIVEILKRQFDVEVRL